MKKLPIIYLMCLFALPMFGQKQKDKQQNEEIIEHKTEIQGQAVTMMIIEGDTLIIADLEEAQVASPRKFRSKEEYRHYLRMRYHATKVYPYAVEAIKVFREVEYWAQDKNKRQRKKHIKRLQKDLKKKFEDPLRNLTRTQGRILVEMIEREIETPIFYIIKDMRGPIRAYWWHKIGKMYNELRL